MRAWLLAALLLAPASAAAQAILDGTIDRISGLVPAGTDDLGQGRHIRAISLADPTECASAALYCELQCRDIESAKSLDWKVFGELVGT